MPKKKPVKRRSLKKPAKKAKSKPSKKSVKKRSKPSRPKIVPLSPKTGKEVKPKKGSQVFYGLKEGRRPPIRIPTSAPQDYDKKDLKALQKILTASGANNFVVYEQLTKKVLRDAKGKIQYRTKRGKPVLDESGKKIPLRKVALSGHSKAKERPVLMIKSHGRIRRVQQDHAFHPRDRRKTVDAKLLKVLKVQPGERVVWSKEIFLRGASIFETLRNVKVNVTGYDLRKAGANSLFVEGTVRGYQGRTKAFASNFSLILDKLSDFSRLVAKRIRYKLSDMGYRFTSLVDLQRYQDEIEEEGEVENNLFYIGRKKPVPILRPIVPESPFQFENPVTSRFMLGTENRLTAGGKRLRKPENSPLKVSVSLRITGYTQVTRKKKSPSRKKLYHGKRDI